MRTEHRHSAAEIFRVGGRVYHLVVAERPLVTPDGRRCMALFDHPAGVLRVDPGVPVRRRPWVVAVAVGDAHRHLASLTPPAAGG